MNEIDISIKLFLDDAYSTLLRNYCLWTIACLLLFFILPPCTIRFIQRREKKTGKKAYLFKNTTKSKGHYIFMAFFLFAGIRGAFSNITNLVPGGVWISMIPLVLIVAADVQLFRWRPSGIILAFAALLSFAIARNYILTSRFYDGATHIAAKYAYYVTNHILYFAAVATSIAVVATVEFLTIYYYRRRFVFRNVASPRCDNCGNYIFPGDKHCICCGKELDTGSARVDMSVLPQRLDKELFCHNCGRATRFQEDYECKWCEGGTFGNIAKKTLLDKLKSAGIGLILAAVAFVILFIPLFNPLQVQNGVASIRNEFVEAWNEYDGETEAQLQRLNAARDALFTADSRWLYVKPWTISSAYAAYFIEYSVGAYDQMQALTEMWDFVNGKSATNDVSAGGKDAAEDEELKASLESRFNQSTNWMAFALTQVVTNRNAISVLEFNALDGLRYWAGQLNLNWLCVPLLVLSPLLLIIFLNSFDERRQWNNIISRQLQKEWRIQTLGHDERSPLMRAFLAIGSAIMCVVALLMSIAGILMSAALGVGTVLSVFRPRNFRAAYTWLRHGLFDHTGDRVKKRSEKYKEFKIKNFRDNLIGGAIGLALIAVVFAFTFHGTDEKNDFDELATAAVMGYSVQISQTLLQIQATNQLEDADGFIALIDKQIAADQAVINYAGKVEDMELANGAKMMASADIDSLTVIRNRVEDKLVPSNEEIRNFVAVRGQNYKWVLEKMALGDMTDFLTGFVDDN